jgi:hypothetical protein
MVILVNIAKKSWKFMVKSGLVFFVWTVIFIGAISLFSLVQKGTIYYGNRCSAILDYKAIDYLNQEEIIAFDYELSCNTLYLDLSVKENMNEEQIISLLVRISTYYSSINLTNDTQVTAKNNQYLILASLIDDGSVSLSISEL